MNYCTRRVRRKMYSVERYYAVGGVSRLPLHLLRISEAMQKASSLEPSGISYGIMKFEPSLLRFTANALGFVFD